MEKLPKTFVKWNSTWHEIQRRGDHAIYQQIGRNGAVHFVVFKILKRKASQIGKQFIKAAEMVPSDAHWGLYGWTFKELEKAQNKFLEVTS